MNARSRARSHTGQYWPGFVDALSTLLMAFIFLVVVFVLAQVVLSRAISGKDAALEQLNRQVSELADLLDLERRANADLRSSVAQLSASLQNTVAERDDLELRLGTMTSRAETAERNAADAQKALAELQSTVKVSRESLELRLAEIVSLRRDIEALKQVRAKLEANVAQLTGETGALRDRSKELEARLADEQERTLLAQKEIKEREVKLAEVYELYQGSKEELASEKKLTSDQKAIVLRLNREVEALRSELKRLAAALDVAETKDKESQATIANLGQRLNRALASKVEELSRYRSEFFGRLREILGDRKDIQIVGDRFVFQSEVLFDTASAEIGDSGKEQLAKLATELKQIAKKIPDDLNWLLRVDGHTDARPISTPEFASNWELSTARAISVVKFLISQGVPAEHLAATGFADNQPLDDRQDEIAYRRNRRIELKLTER